MSQEMINVMKIQWMLKYICASFVMLFPLMIFFNIRWAKWNLQNKK